MSEQEKQATIQTSATQPTISYSPLATNSPIDNTALPKVEQEHHRQSISSQNNDEISVNISSENAAAFPIVPKSNNAPPRTKVGFWDFHGQHYPTEQQDHIPAASKVVTSSVASRNTVSKKNPTLETLAKESTRREPWKDTKTTVFLQSSGNQELTNNDQFSLPDPLVPTSHLEDLTKEQAELSPTQSIEKKATKTTTRVNNLNATINAAANSTTATTPTKSKDSIVSTSATTPLSNTLAPRDTEANEAKVNLNISTNAQAKSENTKSVTVSSYDVVTPYQKQIQSKLPNVYFIVILLSIVSITPGLANTGFNPAILKVSSHFGVNLERVQALSATYFLGLGIGQLLWGPITDRFGRRKSIITCSILAVLINFIFINTQTYGQLQIARFFQGVIFSCFGLLPTAVLRDSYSPRNFIIYNSWVMILFLLAPAFAPLLGGYILISLGWQWIFTSISGICVLALTLFLLKIPETLDPQRRQPINPLKIVKNYWSILSSGKSILCLSLGGISSVVLFAWTALCSALLINDYHIEPQHIGYYSIFPVIFTIIANKTNGSLVRKYNPQKILVTATLVQTLCAISNLIVAFYFLGPIGLVIAQTLNALFTGFQNANLVSIYLMDYSHMVGTASSLFLSIRTIVPSLLIFIISFEPRYMGKTFLFFDAAIIVITLGIVLLFNRLYPTPGDRMHRLRAYVMRRGKRYIHSRFGSSQ